MSKPKLGHISCPEWLEVVRQTNLPSSTIIKAVQVKAVLQLIKSESTVHLNLSYVCRHWYKKTDVLPNLRLATNINNHTYLYILAVFPSSSGIATSGAVAGYVTGI